MESNLLLSVQQQLNYKMVQESTEAVIRAHSKTFYFATSLLPPDARVAIRSLYAFCRSSDDLVDCTDTSLRDLENWRAKVALPANQQTDPLLYAWALVREQYGVDRRYERELLDGVEMDLRAQNYQTWQELETYCYRVASTVGLLSMPIIGLAKGACFEQAAPAAIKLGIALQLTNILRDVGEDAAMGRVYFPEEDLRRFQLARQDILNRTGDQRFVALMKFEIQRARRLYEEALPGIGLLSPAARPAVGAAALLYRAILDQVEAIQYRVFEERAHTSGKHKLLMLPGILLKVYTLRKPKNK
jgi:15-cis-phytoene synthase